MFGFAIEFNINGLSLWQSSCSTLSNLLFYIPDYYDWLEPT